MFGVLQKRIPALNNRIDSSNDDLHHLEVDSVDSICLSDSIFETSTNTTSTQSICRAFEMRMFNKEEQQKMESYCKNKVISNIKFIKQLNTKHCGTKNMMSLITFFELLHNRQYHNIRMNLVSQFISKCKMLPKPYYLHYYMFFLCYVAYYHHIRFTTDVLDDEMIKRHNYLYICARYQLKILQYIINCSRS